MANPVYNVRDTGRNSARTGDVREMADNMLTSWTSVTTGTIAVTDDTNTDVSFTQPADTIIRNIIAVPAGNIVTAGGSGNDVDFSLGTSSGGTQIIATEAILDDGGSAVTSLTLDMSAGGIATFSAAANVAQGALTSSSNAVAWDASAKPNAFHVTTENTTFSAPSNAVEGSFICIEINYNGSHSIGWNTVFEFAASTEATETATDGKTDIHVFRYNGAVWQEVGRTLNLAES